MMARQLGCGQVPPRLFLHEYLKPREDIKESMQAKRVFEYKCSTTVYAHRPFVLITVTHLSFTPWLQELHDHIFNVPVQPLCLELMPDFNPTSEVIYLFPSFSIIPLFTDQAFVIFCRIYHLPHLPGQSPIILKAQSLPWDINLLLWLN
jgi:hypothetical protein